MGRRTHSTWTPDEGHRWTIFEAACACVRANTHRFLDPPKRQETRADADVDGARQTVAASREIVRCRDGHRILFVTHHDRPWGPAVRETCHLESGQLTLGLTVATGAEGAMMATMTPIIAPPRVLPLSGHRATRYATCHPSGDTVPVSIVHRVPGHRRP